MTEPGVQQKREYQIISRQIETMCILCDADPKVVVDLLTGYLWDEQEAGGIKDEFKT